MTAARVLISAQASPELSGAYARVARELAIELSKRRPVSVLGVHGNAASVYQLAGTDVTVHPYPWQYFSGAHINRMAQQLGAAIVVHIGDGWRYAEELVRASALLPWIIHSPIDHRPLTDLEGELARGVAHWAVPTLWGRDAVIEAGGRASYVPHGVSAQLHAGIEGEDRSQRRYNATHALRWPQSPTRFLAVGKNFGDRKNLPGLIRAWADAALPDAELVIWSYPTRDSSVPEAYDLLGAAKDLGVQNIRFPDPYQVSLGVTDEQMGLIYVASDILVQTTRAEGFGLPMAEAQALGIPALITDTEPFLEVAGASGGDQLTVTVGGYDLQQLLGPAWLTTPAHHHLVDRLTYCHRNLQRIYDSDEFAARHQHALRYSWDRAGELLEGAVLEVLDTVRR